MYTFSLTHIVYPKNNFCAKPHSGPIRGLGFGFSIIFRPVFFVEKTLGRRSYHAMNTCGTSSTRTAWPNVLTHRAQGGQSR